MTQLRIKLNINKDHYPTEQSKLAYALSRLKEKALEQMQPYLERDGNIAIVDMNAFYTKLQLAFGDPDRKATAQRELRQLRQKNKEFYLYLSDYQRLVPDTGFDDEAKRSILLDGLSSELKSALKSALITVDLPASLENTIQVLQKIDNRFRSVQASLRKPFTYGGTSRSSSAPSTPITKTSSSPTTPAPRPAPTPSANQDLCID